MAPKTASERRGEQTREDVMRAAESLMAAHGYRATSMNDLIVESGVASSSIYWHFGSKAGVLAALMERGATAFFDSIQAAAPAASHDDPRAALEHVIHHSLNTVKENPSFLTLYFDFLLHPDDEPAVQEQVTAVRKAALETVRAHLRTSYAPYGAKRAIRIADRVAPLAIANFDGLFVALQSNDETNLKRMLKDVADALHFVATIVR